MIRVFARHALAAAALVAALTWTTATAQPADPLPSWNAGAVKQSLELLAYLQANGFQTWICSGGTVDFMRVFAASTYGIPPERIIGSVIKRDSRMLDGRRVIWELPELDSINDKEVKPVNIDRQIGQRPLFVGGNVGNAGDIAMMEYPRDGRDVRSSC